MSRITIRKGTTADISAILAVYDAARNYMRLNGNATQWVGGYPSRELVLHDISQGHCFVGTDDEGDVVMAFAFIIGEDPTYAHIANGSWLNDRPYGTIHRLGSSGKLHGIFKRCIDFCSSQIAELRLDTHADNATMQACALSNGFIHCGTIICADGTPRLAYHRSRSVNP